MTWMNLHRLIDLGRKFFEPGLSFTIHFEAGWVMWMHSIYTNLEIQNLVIRVDLCIRSSSVTFLQTLYSPEGSYSIWLSWWVQWQMSCVETIAFCASLLKNRFHLTSISVFLHTGIAGNLLLRTLSVNFF
ncbi:hypothetical protein XENTR_v10006008 [Xenopus tropicalis]|nr:hypothetical protein XENTR_v10006008 [Xenopus tropicalis]